MKPAGVLKVTKNNDRKHPQQREEWLAGKKFGRLKQRWYEADESVGVIGHWEKVRTA
jgi:hypothetical protein